MKTKYIIIEWPEVQELMEQKGFEDNSYLINDEKRIPSAYFVNEEWYKEICVFQRRFEITEQQ